MERRNNERASNYVELFLETHSSKTSAYDPTLLVTPTVQTKDEMLKLMDQNTKITPLQLTESVFEEQRYGRIMGMGSRVQATNFRTDQRGRAIQNANRPLPYTRRTSC